MSPPNERETRSRRRSGIYARLPGKDC
jgi:hypothetical protein